MNKLRYVGMKKLAVRGYKNIQYGEIIDREDLVQSLSYRKDFELIEDKPKIIPQVVAKKKPLIKRKKGVRNG